MRELRWIVSVALLAAAGCGNAIGTTGLPGSTTSEDSYVGWWYGGFTLTDASGPQSLGWFDVEEEGGGFGVGPGSQPPYFTVSGHIDLGSGAVSGMVTDHDGNSAPLTGSCASDDFCSGQVGAPFDLSFQMNRS